MDTLKRSWYLSRDYFPLANISSQAVNIYKSVPASLNVCVCVCVFFFSCRLEFPAILFQVLALVVEDVRQHSMEICLAPMRWNHETSSWVFSLLMQVYSTLDILAGVVLFPAAFKIWSE